MILYMHGSVMKNYLMDEWLHYYKQWHAESSISYYFNHAQVRNYELNFIGTMYTHISTIL